MSFGVIDKRPAVVRYWALVSTRPAAMKAQEIDDKLTAERKSAS